MEWKPGSLVKAFSYNSFTSKYCVVDKPKAKKALLNTRAKHKSQTQEPNRRPRSHEISVQRHSGSLQQGFLMINTPGMQVQPQQHRPNSKIQISTAASNNQTGSLSPLPQPTTLMRAHGIGNNEISVVIKHTKRSSSPSSIDLVLKRCPSFPALSNTL